MIYPMKPGWQVLDIGANAGTWTAEAVNAGATVVACEPLAHYREQILAAGAAIVLPVAVSDVPDQIELAVGLDDRFSSVHAAWVEEADKKFGWKAGVHKKMVDTLRLDRIIAVYGEFDFIKIDTESHEDAVIRSLGDIKPKRLSLEYHGGKCLLQSCRGVSEQALSLLGDDYLYRFIAESRYWTSVWLELGEAVSFLEGADWGDIVALRKDVQK